jgi:photosystem II stability/assembly factor-like uncharacterized protein
MKNSVNRTLPERTLLTTILLACLLPLSGKTAQAQSGWYPVESGTAAGLNRISWSPGAVGSPSPGALHIVGDSGTFLRSEDVGLTWTIAPNVPTTADLNGLSFPSPDTGLIVGDSGFIFRAQYAGSQWQFTATGPPSSLSVNAAASIPQSVLAYTAGDSGTILRSVTRGLTWTPQNTRTTKNVNAIRMATIARIFACGDSGLILRSLSAGNWAVLPIGSAYQSTDLNAVDIAGSYGDTAWVVGNDGLILQSRNAGISSPTWFAEESGVTTHLRSVRYVNGTLWVVGDSGVILKSVNGGYDWARVESGTTENLRDIVFADPSHGIIVGGNGAVLRTSTAGEYRPVSCSPDHLRFGRVIAGTTKGGVLAVRNSGIVPLDITLAASSNPLFVVSPAAATLPAFGAQAFSVEYSPDGPVIDTASITLQVNGGPYEFLIPATGEGVDSLPQPAWSWLNPRPQGNPLSDIAFFDASDGIAVGDAGTIVRTGDGGQTWSASHYAAGIDAPLRAVWVQDPQSAIAVGDDGLVLHTSDRGASWSARPALAPLENLISVSFAGDTGYAVGWTWYDGGGSAGSIYRTTDGGVTWANAVPGSGNPEGLVFTTPMDVAALSGTTAVAVGWKGPPGSYGSSGLILRTTDAGEHWATIPGLFPSLRTVTFIDQATGIAAGDNGTVLRTTDAGASWTALPSLTTDNLVDVAFSGPDQGIALGSNGTVLATGDGGSNWTASAGAGGSKIWEAVTYAGPGVAFGLNGAQSIYASTDAGATWEMRSGSAETDAIISVSFRDAANGIAVGVWGDLLKTSDGGATWNSLSEGTLLPYAGHYLTSACYVQPDNITVVGNYGTIVHSSDGGASWVERTSGTTGALYDVSFSGPDIGYAVGDGGTILRTADGGEHWHSQTTSWKTNLSAVEPVGGAGAIIIGDAGVILRTTDGGQNWHSVPSGTTAWLADVEFAGESGIVVGSGGTVLVTADGGETWSSKDAGTTNSLIGVSLSESGFGTAVGSWGTITRTTDAGMTWTPVPSGTNASLRDVSFVDDLVGTVVGEYGVILRTTTGGIPPTTISDIALPPLPGWYRLDQNYPNPFNPATTIRFRLPVESKVALRIYDMLGRVVTTLVDGVRQAGEQSVAWDARGVASGVYVSRLEATGVRSPGENFTRDIRMVLVR